MNFETKRALQALSSVVGSILQEMLIVALDNRLTPIRKREWAETFRNLADRIERIKEEDGDC